MARIQLTANAGEESGSYEPVPDGEYVLRCVKVTDKVAGSGRDMVNLELVIDEGPYKGRKVWTNVTFINAGEAGHGLMVQALHAFGLEHDGELDFDSQEFEDKTCRAKLVTESYQKDGVMKLKNAIPTAGFMTESNGAAKPAAAAPAKQPAPAKAAAVKAKAPEQEEAPF